MPRKNKAYAAAAQANFKAYIWGVAGYAPTPLQDEAHSALHRLKLIAGGIRAGKSFSGAMELLSQCSVPNGLFWIVGPDYEQANPEFDYTYQVLQQGGMIKGTPSLPSRGAKKMQTIWGAKIETKTADDVRKLASVAPNGIVMAEAAQHPNDSYLKLLERGLEHDAWIWMCGTFESSLGWYADLFEKWQGANPEQGKSFSLPTWSNLHSFPGGRTDPKILALEASMPEDLFLERCAAIPCKPQGLVHKGFDPKIHVKKLVLDTKYPVELAIDPGYSGAYAVLFVQRIKNTVYVLGEIYERGLIAQEVLPKVRAHPLYKYCREGVIDRAGTQHHANYSQVEIWNRYCPEIQLRWHYVTEEEGIDALNLRLKADSATGIPRLLFDESLKIMRTPEGLAQGILGEFLTRKWRPYREGSGEPRRPIKANDHALNALGYYLYDNFGPVVVKLPTPVPIQRNYWS